MKYLDMENASLEVEIFSKKKLKYFLENFIKEVNCMNFKRVTIIIKYINVNDAIDIINTNVNFYTCNCLIMLEVQLHEIPSVDFSNFIIINTSKKMFKHDNIYNKIFLTKYNTTKITNCLHKDINIIVEPVINTKNIKEFNELLLKIYKDNTGYEISLGGFLIPIELIKEHPCNAYLCDGWKCGKKISQLPKMIYIDRFQNIYPHKIIHNKVLIGNLEKIGSLQEILTNYFDSPKYNYLKNIEKKVFIKYILNYPYSLFPLDKYMEKELYND